MTRGHLFPALFFAISLSAFAQEVSTTEGPLSPPPALTVAGVIKLHQAEVDDSVILAELRQANQPFHLSVDDVLALKQADVSDAVIRAMIAPAPKAAVIRNETFEKFHSMNPTDATLPYGAGDTPVSDNPLIQHDSGIYIDRATAGADKLSFLDRAALSGSKANAGAVFSFFIYPVTFKYQINSPKSQVRTTDTTPVFYFYFEDKAAGLGKSEFSAADASAPQQFTLVRLDAAKKERDLPAVKFGIFNGVSNGEKTMPFTSERLRAGLYKVTVSKALKPGEYAFVLPPAKGTYNPNDPDAPKPDVFDFGVDRGN